MELIAKIFNNVLLLSNIVFNIIDDHTSKDSEMYKLEQWKEKTGNWELWPKKTVILSIFNDYLDIHRMNLNIYVNRQ